MAACHVWGLKVPSDLHQNIWVNNIQPCQSPTNYNRPPLSLSITKKIKEKLPQNGIKIRNQTSSHRKKTRQTTAKESQTGCGGRQVALSRSGLERKACSDALLRAWRSPQSWARRRCCPPAGDGKVRRFFSVEIGISGVLNPMSNGSMGQRTYCANAAKISNPVCVIFVSLKQPRLERATDPRAAALVKHTRTFDTCVLNRCRLSQKDIVSRSECEFLCSALLYPLRIF